MNQKSCHNSQKQHSNALTTYKTYNTMMFLELTVALLATSLGYAQQEDPAEVASSFLRGYTEADLDENVSCFSSLSDLYKVDTCQTCIWLTHLLDNYERRYIGDLVARESPQLSVSALHRRVVRLIYCDRLFDDAASSSMCHVILYLLIISSCI